MTNVAPPRRLNGITAEPGTLLGPNALGELIVVRRQDDDGVIVGYAGVKDIAAAREVVLASGPRSITEDRMSASWRAAVMPS